MSNGKGDRNRANPAAFRAGWEYLEQQVDMIESTDWKEIPEFPGYFASKYGHIKNSQGRLLTTYLDPDGYHKVSPRCQYRSVHRLVLQAFIGPCPDGMEACHGPNGRNDNALSNLSWGTRSKNQGEDRRRDGTIGVRELNGRAKLCQAQADEIRVRLCNGESQTSIAKDYKISQAQVSRIKLGKVW